MKFLRSASIIGLSLGFGLAGAAMTPRSHAAERDSGNRVTPDAKSLAAGRELYTANCADCHGVAGKGDGRMAHELKKPPTDLTDADSLASTDTGLFHSISRGRRPMPGFEKLLNEQERWHIVNYVRTLARDK